MWTVLRLATAVLLLYCGWSLAWGLDEGGNFGLSLGVGLVTGGLAAVVIWPERRPQSRDRAQGPDSLTGGGAQGRVEQAPAARE